jgi:DUF1680 family protein
MSTLTSAKKQLSPVAFTQVQFDDDFWAPKIETNRTVTIPHVFEMCEDSGRWPAFDLNYERPVPSPIVLIFGDSDPAKLIEAVGYSLATHPDPALEEKIDREIDRIVAAQEPDGYLNSHFSHAQPDMKWKNLRDWHELYCAGHLMEGAIAYAQATGKRKLLDAMLRYADHINARFGRDPGKLRGYCGHPEIELALVKLARATGNQRYMDLSKYMVEERGQQPYYFDIEAVARGDDPSKFWAKSYEYCQAHVPIRQQTQAVGHAVRAMYLFSAVADLADEFDDPTLLKTCEHIWDAMVTKRMYLTGGIGPSHSNEGFTRDYDLPDESAYAETCAAIGLVLWGHRMLQFNGDGKFADIIERALYNGTLSGVSLDGSHFFYENPLASIGNHHRVLWFACPCCPPNVARTIASVGNYFYSTSVDGSASGVWVHLYGQNTAQMAIGNSHMQLRQVTNYPWDGNVHLALSLSAPSEFTLHLRVPGWCDGYSVSINQTSVSSPQLQNGYIALTRVWQSGDVIEFNMAMPVQSVYAHPSVRQMQGRVALQRGPLVYCLEGVDNDQAQLERISVDADAVKTFEVEHRSELLGGVTVIRGEGTIVSDEGWDGMLYRGTPSASHPIQITAIPYYSWDNRDPGEMRVWLRTHG